MKCPETSVICIKLMQIFLPVASNGNTIFFGLQYHRITEHAKFEGTHKDHWIHVSPAERAPRVMPRSQEHCQNTSWTLSSWFWDHCPGELFQCTFLGEEPFSDIQTKPPLMQLQAIHFGFRSNRNIPIKCICIKMILVWNRTCTLGYFYISIYIFSMW